ncbi:hypothetical protein PsorP6_010965 [Peronosclerospora sorghi]|uniref:Uncharacterized protein n=1 Tax=Peronosclerospora sorghi TaxID=230839 RepID=A0ACC0VVJ0_9STRA|nr:hypothetical protein PsorP6_010965 [Peronosclerospora sorghi]
MPVATPRHSLSTVYETETTQPRAQDVEMAAGRTTIDPRDTVLIFQEVFTLEQATRRETLEESNLREILPLYKFNHKSGTKSRSKSLHKDDEALVASRSENLAQARRLANELNRKYLPTQVVAPSASQMLDEADDEALRWFVYPSEVAEAIKKGDESVILDTLRGPFHPARYNNFARGLQDQWNDALTSSAHVCSPLTCCTALQIPASQWEKQPQKVAFSSNGCVMRGNYPLRSTIASEMVVAECVKF